MGRGMAMVRGVTHRGLASSGASAAWPRSARRWFSIAPHALAAGDHTAGLEPLVAGSGHPSASRDAAAPDDLFSRRTKAQPLRRETGELLKACASPDSRSNFSGEAAMSTTVQLAGACCEPPLRGDEVQEAARTASATTHAVRVRLIAVPPSTPAGGYP